MTRYSGERKIANHPVVGSGQRALVYAQMLADILAVQSNGVDNDWEVYDSLSATSKVLKSVGDRSIDSGFGDTHIYVHFFLSGTYLAAVTYSDIDNTVTHSGRRQNATATNVAVDLSDTAETDVRMWINNFEVSIQVTYAGLPHGLLYFGMPRKAHIPPSFAGQFINRDNGITAGSNVSIPTLLDMRGVLQPGQRIDIIDQTPEGDAILADHVETPTVVEVNVDNVVVDTISSNFGEGALVGLGHNVCSFGTKTVENVAYPSHKADGTYALDTAISFVVPPLINSLSAFGFVRFKELVIGDATNDDLGVVDGFVFLVDTGATLSEDDFYFVNANTGNGYRIRNTGPDVVANAYLVIRHGPL